MIIREALNSCGSQTWFALLATLNNVSRLLIVIGGKARCYVALGIGRSSPEPVPILQRHIVSSQTLQELHQCDFILPVFLRRRTADFASRESLGLHFQVNIRVNTCRVEV